jgi:hypothetical protein
MVGFALNEAIAFRLTNTLDFFLLQWTEVSHARVVNGVAELFVPCVRSAQTIL